MYARLSRFTGMEGEALAGSLQWFRTEGLPRLERIQSFRTIFFGVNLAEGKATGITCWSSADAMRLGEAAENPIRDEAMRRAGTSLSRGLIDTYEVAFTDSRPTLGRSPVLKSRLARWEGLKPGQLREAQDHFIGEHYPTWAEHPSFRGILMCANRMLGNTLSITLWETDNLDDVKELEREATERLSTRGAHGPVRPLHFDTYDVALVPELAAAAAPVA